MRQIVRERRIERQISREMVGKRKTKWERQRERETDRERDSTHRETDRYRPDHVLMGQHLSTSIFQVVSKYGLFCSLFMTASHVINEVMETHNRTLSLSLFTTPPLKGEGDRPGFIQTSWSYHPAICG